MTLVRSDYRLAARLRRKDVRATDRGRHFSGYNRRHLGPGMDYRRQEAHHNKNRKQQRVGPRGQIGPDGEYLFCRWDLGHDGPTSDSRNWYYHVVALPALISIKKSPGRR